MSWKKKYFNSFHHPVKVDDELLNFISSLESSKISQMKVIREKIFNSLSLSELLFLRKFCRKHWYNQLYTALGFDNIYQKNK